MKKNHQFILCIIVIILTSTAQQLEIVDIYNHSNNADYLIITPQMFSECAMRLAQYRNEFGGDDVEKARYAIIENIYEKYQGTQISPDSILRETIAWSIDRWESPPSYIVLIGNDVVVWTPGDSLPHHSGPMPSRIEWNISQGVIGDLIVKKDTTVEYDDFWLYKSYIDSVSGNEILRTNLPAFGRIPCDRQDEFDRYLQKVKYYDGLRAAPWRNRVLFLMDNSMLATTWDPIDHTTCGINVMQTMKGRFQTGLYMSRFKVDSTLRFINVRESFFSSMNNGCGWTVFFAHGHPSKLTNEQVLNVDDTPLFKNSTIPTIVFSMSCSNGAFYEPVDKSMCKKWLFSTDGGAVAYVASPNMEYANFNTKFMVDITRLNDSLSMSIGNLLARAKLSRKSDYCQDYNILGDPALRASPARVRLNLQRISDRKLTCAPESGFVNGDSLYWECTGKIGWTDSIRNLDYVTDTLLFWGTTTLANNIAEVELPSAPESDTLRFTAYAWNKSFESRGEMLFEAGSAIPVKNRVNLGSRQFHIKVLSPHNLVLSIENVAEKSTAEMYNVNGRHIGSVIIPSGRREFVWHNPLLSPGTYIVRFRTLKSKELSVRIVMP